MLRIDRRTKALKRLDQKALPEAGLKERHDIQPMIRNSPDPFFEEMGEKLLLIAEEVRPTDFVDDRIDLLAIDQQGAVVVLELKRGPHKLHLLQALSYAAMVSTWDREALISERAKLTRKTFEDAEDEIEQFLSEDIEDLNELQRVMLLAEDFEYEVLVTAKWMTEKYDLDIRCYRLALSSDNEAEFLTCTCIYPPSEIVQHATRRGRQGGVRREPWPDWDMALANIQNPAVLDFFKRELAAGQDNYLRKRILHYRLQGRRRFEISAHKKAAYVWQAGRFRDDVKFWVGKIGTHADVKPVRKDRTSLRFFLSSEQDFGRFSDAFKNDLQEMEFLVTWSLSLATN
jgi:hypothetical protein